MANPVPDLFLRLSKKIAQITKVVQQLKTRGDDAEREARHFEHEFYDVVAETAAKLADFRDMFEAERARAAAEATETAVAAERTKAQADRAMLLAQHTLELAQQREAATATAGRLESELADLRQEFAERLHSEEDRRSRETRQAAEEAERRRAAELEALTRHAREELEAERKRW
jgi:hypothetical protein